MSKVLRVSAKRQVNFVSRRQAGELAEDLGTRVAVIQALIPLGLEAVCDVLQRRTVGGTPLRAQWWATGPRAVE